MSAQLELPAPATLRVVQRASTDALGGTDGALVLMTDVDRQDGLLHCALYRETLPNAAFPQIECGIWATVTRVSHWKGTPYLLEAYAEKPDFWRDYMGERERYATLDEAVAALRAWLPRAQAFVAAVDPGAECDCCKRTIRRAQAPRCASCARNVGVHCGPCTERRRARRAGASR